MTTQAQYNAAGQILATVWPTIITDPNQIAALAAQGISLVVIPDGKSGATGSIINGAYQDYPPPPPAIPSVITQTAVALVNTGLVPSTFYHPTTIAQINAAQTAVGLPNMVSTTPTPSPAPTPTP